MQRLAPVLAVSTLLLVAACGAEAEPGGARVFDEDSVVGALAALPYAEPRGRTQVIVVTGDLDGVAADAFVPPVQYVDLAAGVRWFAELRDGLDRFAVRAGDDGKRVASSTEQDQLRDWERDKGRRLIDHTELADVAEAMVARSVHAAYLVAGSFDQFRGHPPPDAIDEEFEAVGMGFSGSADEQLVHVAYWFDDDLVEAAEQVEATWRHGNSRRSHRPLSELATVRDVRRDGHVVTVDLEPGAAGPGFVFELLTTADTPFQGGD